MTSEKVPPYTARRDHPKRHQNAQTSLNLLCCCTSVARLAVRTTDFRLAFQLMQTLKQRGIKFDLLDYHAPLPYGDTVWMATELETSERGNEGLPVAATIESIDGAVERAIQHLRGVHQIHELTFGVDPGPRPGVAWMGDGVLLGMAQLESVGDVVGHIRSIEKAVHHASTVIRIGDGAPLLRDHIINECLAEGLLVEQVDEAKTSKGLLRHNHVVSAVRIALLVGLRVWEQRSISPTMGELKEIQRQSRKLSQGRITISTKLALAVARRELNLHEALAS